MRIKLASRIVLKYLKSRAQDLFWVISFKSTRVVISNSVELKSSIETSIPLQGSY